MSHAPSSHSNKYVDLWLQIGKKDLCNHEYMISKTLQGHSSEKTPSLFHLMIGAMLMHAILFTHTQFLTFLLVRLWQSETVNFDRSLASNVHIFSEWALDSVYIYWYSRSQMSIFVCILTTYTHLWASMHINKLAFFGLSSEKYKTFPLQLAHLY